MKHIRLILFSIICFYGLLMAEDGRPFYTVDDSAKCRAEFRQNEFGDIGFGHTGMDDFTFNGEFEYKMWPPTIDDPNQHYIIIDTPANGKMTITSTDNNLFFGISTDNPRESGSYKNDKTCDILNVKQEKIEMDVKGSQVYYLFFVRKNNNVNKANIKVHIKKINEEAIVNVDSTSTTTTGVGSKEDPIGKITLSDSFDRKNGGVGVGYYKAPDGNEFDIITNIPSKPNPRLYNTNMKKLDYSHFVHDEDGYFDKQRVNGDYIIVGNTVAYGNGSIDTNKRYNLKQDNSFSINSSKSVVKLPVGIKAEDIKYAKLFWSGNFQGRAPYIKQTKKYDFRSKLMEITRDYDSAAYKIADRVKKTINPRDTKVDKYYYGTVNQTWSNTWNKNNGSISFFYTASADILKDIKEYVGTREGDAEKNEIEFDFTAGEIKFSANQDPLGYCSLMGGSPGCSVRGFYGNWSLVIVYDKKEALLKSDPLYEYYKPRAINIYKGMALQAPPIYNSHRLQPRDTLDENKLRSYMNMSELELSFDGFYTPDSPGYSAKLTISGSIGSSGNIGESMKIKTNKSQSYKSLKNTYNIPIDENVNKGQLNGSTNDIITECTFERDQKGNIIKSKKPKCSFKERVLSSNNNQGELGFDIDTYNLTNIMQPNETSFNVFMRTLWLRAADEFVPNVVAMSTEIYVPDLCYIERIYNIDDWFKWYKYDKVKGTDGKETGEISGISKIDNPKVPDQDIIKRGDTLIAGQELYYRVLFRNQSEHKTSAKSTVITIDTGSSNIYTQNSLGINNDHQSKNINDNQYTKYLKDNQKGVYANYNRLGSPSETNMQFNTFESSTPKLYLGKGAGSITGTTPTGGDFDSGYQSFVEFNATVGTKSYKYERLKYKAGYVVQDGAGKILADYRNKPVPMNICKEDKDYTENTKINIILPLDGLKVVNQNVKVDSKEFSKQDERLYVQVAELPFDVNLIYAPNLRLNNGFITLCNIFSDDGGCKEFNVEAIKAEIANGVPLDKFFEIDSSGQITGNVKQFLPFPFPGKISLSLIDNKVRSLCKDLNDKDKIKFAKECGKDKSCSYNVDNYDLGDVDTNKIYAKELKNISIPDAFQHATFMVTYTPSEELNINKDTDALQSEIDELREKKEHNKLTTAEEKKLEELEQQLKITTDISKFLGVERSNDGKFRVCKSDTFAVRPASFTIVKPNGDKTPNYENAIKGFTKYAKLVDMSEENTGDVTKQKAIKNDKAERIAGDYKDNSDILKAFYARSYLNHPVTNYTHVFGGDFTNRISLRNDNFKLYDIDKSHTIRDYKQKTQQIKLTQEDIVAEDKNALIPFISDKCQDTITGKAFFGKKDRTVTISDATKQTDCAYAFQYDHFTFNGKTYRYKTGSGGNSISPSEKCVKFYKDQPTGQKIWDINGIPLKVEFNYKDIQESGGKVAKTTKISDDWRTLLKEANTAPASKTARPALVTIPSASNKDISNMKEAMFNYFNAGDAMIHIYDNTFTKTDQGWAGENNEFGPTCIIGSTSNKHTTKEGEGASYAQPGMVGCDIGMADDKYLVLRYVPKNIEVSINGLGDSSDNSINSDGNIATPDTTFTYFNSPEPNLPATLSRELGITNAQSNKALLNDLRNLATLDFNATAYADNAVYNGLVTTLYDGRRLIEYNDIRYPESQRYSNEVAVCGFANDIRFNVGLDFNCSNATYRANDPRCNNTINAQTTTEAITYRPFGLSDDSSVAGIGYKIPAGQEFIPFEPASRDDTAANKNDCRYAPYDSRCLIFTNRNGRSEVAIQNPAQKVLPIELAISFYGDATKRSGVFNTQATSASVIYNPKSSNLTILDSAFSNGVASGANARIYLNFDRMQKQPQRPLLITASDFVINNINLVTNIQPPKFNKNFELVDKDGKDFKFTTSTKEESFVPKVMFDKDRFERITANTKVMAKEFWEAFKGKTPNELNTSSRVSHTALFVYGKRNHDSDGSQSNMFLTSQQQNNIANIHGAVYCDSVNNCIKPNIELPASISSKADIVKYALSRKTTMFDEWVSTTGGGNLVPVGSAPQNAWLRIMGAGTLTTNNDKIAKFVRGYQARNEGDTQDITNPTLTRVGAIIDEFETLDLTFANNDRISGRVRVLVEPWLIYTPFINTVTLTGDVDPAKKYYNYFDFLFFTPRAQWGGEGWVKGQKDDVGNFIMKDDIEHREVRPLKQNNRINW